MQGARGSLEILRSVEPSITRTRSSRSRSPSKQKPEASSSSTSFSCSLSLLTGLRRGLNGGLVIGEGEVTSELRELSLGTRGEVRKLFSRETGSELELKLLPFFAARGAKKTIRARQKKASSWKLRQKTVFVVPKQFFVRRYFFCRRRFFRSTPVTPETKIN